MAVWRPTSSTLFYQLLSSGSLHVHPLAYIWPARPQDIVVSLANVTAPKCITVAHCSMDLHYLKMHPTLSFTSELPDLLFRATWGFPAATFGLSDESSPCLAYAGHSEEGESCGVIESASLF